MSNMKLFLILILTGLSISCGFRAEKQVPVQTVAPTVRVPKAAEKVDIKPVIDRSRQVEESNRQLSNELTKNKAIVFDLRRQLQAASVAAVVTPEQWAALKERAEELETSREELEAINGDQHEALVLLSSALTDTSLQVTLVQGSLDESLAALDEANEKIEKLTQAHEAIGAERDKAVQEFAASEGQIKELKSQSWKRLVWAGGATALCVVLGYLVLKP